MGAWWDLWPKPWDPHVRNTVNIVGSTGDTFPFYNTKREQMLKSGPAVCSDSFLSLGPTFLEFYRSAILPRRRGPDSAAVCAASVSTPRVHSGGCTLPAGGRACETSVFVMFASSIRQSDLKLKIRISD